MLAIIELHFFIKFGINFEYDIFHIFMQIINYNNIKGPCTIADHQRSSV